MKQVRENSYMEGDNLVTLRDGENKMDIGKYSRALLCCKKSNLAGNISSLHLLIHFWLLSFQSIYKPTILQISFLVFFTDKILVPINFLLFFILSCFLYSVVLGQLIRSPVRRILHKTSHTVKPSYRGLNSWYHGMGLLSWGHIWEE